MTRSTARNGNRARRWIERILFLGGVAALCVWAGQNVVSTVWQAWENRVFDLQVGDRQIAEQPASASGAAASASRPPAIAPRPPARDVSIIGRLTIPRLHLSAMVREGADEDTLSLALGHVPGTALPGQQGNVAVAGHRDTLFRSLRGIKKYDLIRLETVSSGSFLYQVRSMEIVDPTDVGVLKASPDSELTLVTCYPFNYIGSAPERFIVKAREVDRAPRGVEGQQISFR